MCVCVYALCLICCGANIVNVFLKQRVGSFHSHDIPNGLANVAHGGSSARGNGPSTAGTGLSTEAYRSRHEITITVSIKAMNALL